MTAEIPTTRTLPINVISLSSLRLQLTTGKETLICINNPEDSAAGQDGIKASLIKAIAPAISEPLSYIVNLLKGYRLNNVSYGKRTQRQAEMEFAFIPQLRS